MNFSFTIIRLGGNNRRCQFYSIVKEGEELDEAAKFLQNVRNQESDDFNRLKVRFTTIKNKTGAILEFFKDEGAQKSLVKALHAGAKRDGYLQVNSLRWYCIRLSKQCVIFGNGGVKHVGKTQQDDHLREKENDMRWVDKCIEAAQRSHDLELDEHGNLIGIVEFNKEVIENYGIQ
ncbi:MAG: hypothetical protein WD607_05405 [Candidatus Paceibacterota bacterium]